MTPSATPENSVGVIRLVANLPFRRRFLRPPSTEAPSLYRNYPVSSVVRPLRHPRRPSLPLTRCQLIAAAITDWGFPCCDCSPSCLHAITTTPAEPMDLFARTIHRLRPSPSNERVGFCIVLFGACSVFTHVTASRLAESPLTLSTRGFSGFIASATALIATGWSEPVPGWDLHPLKNSAFHGAPLGRWDEKAGLPRDAIRSQCSTCLKHKEKETGNARD